MLIGRLRGTNTLSELTCNLQNVQTCPSLILILSQSDDELRARFHSVSSQQNLTHLRQTPGCKTEGCLQGALKDRGSVPRPSLRPPGKSAKISTQLFS